MQNGGYSSLSTSTAGGGLHSQRMVKDVQLKFVIIAGTAGSREVTTVTEITPDTALFTGHHG